MNPMTDMDEFKAPSRVERIAAATRGFVHKVSSVPVVGWLLNKLLLPLSALATMLDSGGAVAKGEYGEGFKRAVSGVADVAVTAAMIFPTTFVAGATFWLVNGLSAIITSDTLAEHARNLTRGALDTISPDAKENRDLTELARNSQVLGAAPRTIGSRTAAVGFAPSMEPQMMATQDNTALPNPYAPNRMEAMPTNHFTNAVATRRGMTPEQAEQARTAWVNNNRDEYRALRAAAGGQQGAMAAESGRS